MAINRASVRRALGRDWGGAAVEHALLWAMLAAVTIALGGLGRYLVADLAGSFASFP